MLCNEQATNILFVILSAAKDLALR